MKRTIPHNKPIATVIRNYMDKKSGKVTESRDEIRRRFYGLDWKDQKKIMNAFLDAGVSDRQWAYSRLLDLWDASFETKTRKLWEEHQEERCAWVIIRHFPLAYIREHMDELGDGRNYYFICRRMATETDFEIDRNKLDDLDYLMTLYHADRKIEDEEANDILFGIIHDVSVHWWPSLALSKNYRPDRTEMMSTVDFDKVSMAMYYTERMRCEEVIRTFREWDAAVQAKVSKSEEYARLNRQPLSDQDYTSQLADIFQKQLFLSLPEKYKKKPVKTQDQQLP